MKISKLSIFSGEINTMDIAVTMEQINVWLSGKLIQDAMPNISAEEREFIMTGMTPKEQTYMSNTDPDKWPAI